MLMRQALMATALAAASLLPHAGAQARPQASPATAPAPASVEALAPQLERYFAEWAARAHVPGLAWGIVKDGRLVMVRGIGVQDTATRAPVTADTNCQPEHPTNPY